MFRGLLDIASSPSKRGLWESLKLSPTPKNNILSCWRSKLQTLGFSHKISKEEFGLDCQVTFHYGKEIVDSILPWSLVKVHFVVPLVSYAYLNIFKVYWVKCVCVCVSLLQDLCKYNVHLIFLDPHYVCMIFYNGAMNAYSSLNVPYQSISLKLWMGMQFKFSSFLVVINRMWHCLWEKNK